MAPATKLKGNLRRACSRAVIEIGYSLMRGASVPDPIRDCGGSVTYLIELQWKEAIALLEQPDWQQPNDICQHRCNDLIRLAYGKLYSFAYKDVPLCWPRLYTDASILKAVFQIFLFMNKNSGQDYFENIPGIPHSGNSGIEEDNSAEEDTYDTLESPVAGEERTYADWPYVIVRTLDMGVILAGAVGRNRSEIMEDILQALSSLLREPGTDDFTDTFADDSIPPPNIIHPVSRVNKLTIPAFEHHLTTPNYDGPQPLVIANSLTHWPAFTDRPWKSPSYLLSRTINGRRLVPIEIGQSYVSKNWGQKIISFNQFLKRYITSPSPQRKRSTGYLAQHNLFNQIPSLRKDIAIPDYCYTDPPPPVHGTALASQTIQKLKEPQLNAWFGPASTVSPLHTDCYHNILCQVVGRKYVRLYSPIETTKLYPKGIENGIDMSNTSQVDVSAFEEGLDSETRLEAERKFPYVDRAMYMETVLEEGDCLYIPVGWWHYVRSLSTSFSVSFWWN